MKRVGSYLSTKSAACAALLILSFVASAQVMEGTARVTAIRGSALVSEAGQGFKPLRVGQSLGRGAVIKTATDSQVDLFLKYNGPAIQLASDTTLCLSGLEFDLQPGTPMTAIIDTRLDLRSGRILGYTQALTPVSMYEIKIPKGTIGFRGGGTVFDVSANGTVIINRGSAIVVFTDPGVPPVTIVNAGFTISPSAPHQGQGALRSTPPGSFNALALSINRLANNIPPKFTQGIILPSQQGSNSSAPPPSTLETNRPLVKP